MKQTYSRWWLALALGATGCAQALPTAFPGAPAADKAPIAAPAPRPGVAIHHEAAPEASFIAAERAYRLAHVSSKHVVLHVASDAAVDAAIASGLVRLIRRMPAMDAVLADVTGDDVDAALTALRALPGVRFAERDGVAVVGAGRPSTGLPWRIPRPAMTPAAAPEAPTATVAAALGPNDPSFGSQWAFGPISAVSAWGASVLAAAETTEPVTIAILDTGVDQNHEDIDPGHRLDDQTGKLYRDKNFTTSDTADDKFGHGTHVAGIASAVTNNGVGVAGTFPQARLMNVKVIGDNGIGYDSAISDGIRWAADHGAQVLNMSFGQTTNSTLVREAIAYAAGKGVLMVAAAGNEGTTTKRYPAAYPQVIAVGATTRPVLGQPERRADFSNHDASWVDVAAPGDGILSTLPNHASTVGVKDYGTMKGTSMATPMVAGEAAMIWRAQGGKASKVRARIQAKSDTGVSGSGTDWAHGRINLERALREP